MNLALEEVDFVIGNYFWYLFILNSSPYRKVLTAKLHVYDIYIYDRNQEANQKSDRQNG